MTTHYNNVANAVSGTPGTGTITLGAAITGAQSLATAAGGNATVDVFITDGNAWEVARNCTYTHSGTTLTRGTLEASSTGAVLSLTSAAVVRVSMPASTGNLLQQQINRGLVFVRNDGSTTQTTSAGTTTQITTALTTVVSDPRSEWDATNKRFVPTRPGTYLLEGFIQFGAGQPRMAQANIWVNGAAAIEADVLPGNYDYSGYTIVGVVYLNGAGDYADLRIYTANATATISGKATGVLFKALYLG